MPSMWGELVLIRSRVVLDLVALVLQGYSLYCAPDKDDLVTWHALLLLPLLLTVATSGSLTNRWPLSFPMIPFVLFQVFFKWLSIARDGHLEQGDWLVLGAWLAQMTCRAGSFLFFLLGVLLCVLFPAVQLPAVDGPYQVGVVDLHMPIEHGHVLARILYPTTKEHAPVWKRGIPYLNPSTAIDFCKDTMEMGAPGPLKKFSFMLHSYRLISLPMTRNAKPLDQNELPLCVFSHGLGGTNYIYSYQTMYLASHGYVVLSLDHTDGSAPVVQFKDGTILWRDQTIGQMSMDGKEVESVRARRGQTDLRVDEMLAATKALQGLNERNIPELESLGVSFVGKLDDDHVIFMGHSFGGATAVTAACRLPKRDGNTSCTVVAHEPAMDWAPDDARKMLFATNKLRESSFTYTGGTGGYQEEEEEKKVESIQQGTPGGTPLDTIEVLFLYSDEWAEKQWGGSHLVRCMHRRSQLSGGCDVAVIKDSKHNEFSDINMLTALWLARRVGLTGPRNPVDTAEEIATRTLDFLQNTSKDK